MSMTEEEIRIRKTELRNHSEKLASLERELRSLSPRALLLEKLESSAEFLARGEQDPGSREEALRERTEILLLLEQHPAPDGTADDQVFLKHFRELRDECTELDAHLREIRRELIRDFKNR